MLDKVVAVVQSPVAAFELGVLAEVFGLDRRQVGLPSCKFVVAAENPGMVPTTSGFAIEAAADLASFGDADLVAIPSWPRHLTPSPEIASALAAVVERGGMVLAVCSGAFLLAAVGLLDGRRAATHWRYADELARRYPGVAVDASVLYVVDGPVVTSAGTAAAIDACLHLFREAHGTSSANQLARAMVVAPHREGGQAQFAEAPVSEDGHNELGAVLDRAINSLDEDLSVQRLSSWAHLSPRTFNRRFKVATGTTPGKWVLEQRLNDAERLLETTNLTVPAVAAQSGIGSADNLRHQMNRRRGISPSDYRKMFAPPPAP